MRTALAQALFVEPDLLLLVPFSSCRSHFAQCRFWIDLMLGVMPTRMNCAAVGESEVLPLADLWHSGCWKDPGSGEMSLEVQDEPTNALDLPSILWLQVGGLPLFVLLQQLSLCADTCNAYLCCC